MLYIHSGIFVFVMIIVILLILIGSVETTMNPVSQDKPILTVIYCWDVIFQSYDVIISKCRLLNANQHFVLTLEM